MKNWKLIRDIATQKPEFLVDLIKDAIEDINAQFPEDRPFFKPESLNTREKEVYLATLLKESCSNVIGEEGVKMCILRALEEFDKVYGLFGESFKIEDDPDVVRGIFESFFEYIDKELVMEKLRRLGYF